MYFHIIINSSSVIEEKANRDTPICFQNTRINLHQAQAVRTSLHVLEKRRTLDSNLGSIVHVLPYRVIYLSVCVFNLLFIVLKLLRNASTVHVAIILYVIKLCLFLFFFSDLTNCVETVIPTIH